MEKILLNIVAISHTVTSSNNYAVVLEEEDGNRRLPVVIGNFEAQAIAVAIQAMAATRPLTHDLIKNILEQFEINLQEVIIIELKQGIFYAALICEQNGRIVEIDSRTSDAIALAVRFGCPIYTYEKVLEDAGLVSRAIPISEEETFQDKPKKKKIASLDNKSVDQLESMLQEALTQEDYERAAKLRDEIHRRQSSDS